MDKLPVPVAHRLEAIFFLTAGQFLGCMVLSGLAEWRANHPR